MGSESLSEGLAAALRAGQAGDQQMRIRPLPVRVCGHSEGTIVSTLPQRTRWYNGASRKSASMSTVTICGVNSPADFPMDQDQLYHHIYANEEYRKLASDPEFRVILDVGGRFFRAMIGDREGEFRAWRRVRTLEAAIEWLQSEVRELYPHSPYGERLARARDGRSARLPCLASAGR
jgi:hypothetical protein